MITIVKTNCEKEKEMTNLTELAKEIHENAVKHGWWESERPTEEIFALIHSEWSEALEEARNGRPMIYYNCDNPHMRTCYDTTFTLPGVCNGDYEHRCLRGFKPEGIAVELIDGCIKILDYLVKIHRFNEKEIINDTNDLLCYKVVDNISISALICMLHNNLQGVFTMDKWDYPIHNMHHCIGLVFAWLNAQDIDPMQIMQIKHKYNKTRPYKHGKKF